MRGTRIYLSANELVNLFYASAPIEYECCSPPDEFANLHEKLLKAIQFKVDCGETTKEEICAVRDKKKPPVETSG